MKMIRCEADIWIEKTGDILVRPSTDSEIDIVKLGDSTLFFYPGQLAKFAEIINAHIEANAAAQQGQEDYATEKVDAEAR